MLFVILDSSGGESVLVYDIELATLLVLINELNRDLRYGPGPI